MYFAGGWYYTLYLQALGEGHYETRVTRSQDLLTWTDAPEGRALLTYDPERVPDPVNHPEVRELNASDVELCEWQGKTLLYFNGGDQLGVGDLQWAESEGTPRELLEHFFKR
jgi:alpha-L-fucosidase